MPICQNCGEQWTWSQTVKTIFKLKCPYCSKKQYESASSRWKGSILSVFLLLFILLPLNILFNFSPAAALFFGFVIVVIMLALYPFFLTLSNEKESYW